MTPNQLPPLPEPDTHCFDDDTGKDVWSYTADQMHAYALAALAQQAQEPVYWEWRRLGSNQHAADFGQWSQWQKVEARSLLSTVEDELQEFRRYIADGYKYELRALYTTPPAPQVPAPDIDEAAIARMTKRGADAWAGVDAQSVRGGEQVPAPVDERAEFEACAPMAGSLFKRRADDPDKYWDGNVQDDWELWQARAALQSPSPQTKGQP